MRKSGTGHISQLGYLVMNRGGRTSMAHVEIAERALGKKLPKGACVHHVDRNGLNNVNSNLVILPNRRYHQLIHRRMRALEACGDANALLCVYCKQYDAPDSLVKHDVDNFVHQSCNTKYHRSARSRRSAAEHKGESHHLAKFSKEDILAIRSSPLPPSQLARHYRTSYTYIWKIKNRRVWQHI